MLRRTMILLYGVVSYSIFFGTYLCGVGFTTNIATPTSLDAESVGLLWTAIAISLGLLSLLALQHSGMARPVFKRWLTRFVPKSAERTYTLLSSLALILPFWQWRPMAGAIWECDCAGCA